MAHRVISLLRSKFGRIWSEADINHRAGFMSARPLGTRCCGRPNSLGGGCCTVSAFPQSIVLRCRVTLPFAELRQMLLVDEIDPGLHLGMPALDQDGEFADQPSERNQSNRISSAGRLAKTSARTVSASLRGVTRRPPTTNQRP